MTAKKENVTELRAVFEAWFIQQFGEDKQYKLLSTNAGYADAETLNLWVGFVAGFGAKKEAQALVDECVSSNIKWFLDELATAEPYQFETGELEVFGGDASGREGSVSMSINNIARQALSKIRQLETQEVSVNAAA